MTRAWAVRPFLAVVLLQGGCGSVAHSPAPGTTPSIPDSAPAAGVVPSAIPAATPTAAHDARLQAALETARDSMEIRGISAAVIRADGSVWTGVAGESAPGVAIERTTAFDAGSVAKMFTAAVVLGLAAAGTVDLDGTVAQWLPDAPNAERVTPRMLLNHTSGWSDAWEVPSLVGRVVGAPLRRWTAADVLAATPAPRGEPGASWYYSSTGYVALGEVAERASGRAFDELLRELILVPLDLEHTVHGAYADPVGPLAHGWLDIDNDGVAENFTALLPAVSFRTAAGTAGAILTTASDAARFTRAFVTGELAGAAAIREWVARPDGNHHGLGVLRIELDGIELIGHRGNAAGYSAAAWHAPESGVTVAVLTNRHGVLVSPVVAALLGVLRD
jgi:D-alanyl-D-alanine carboxypeptidase